MKRTPLNRGKPLTRSTTPMRRGTPLSTATNGLSRSGRLAPESARRKAERPARQAVRETALRRAGHRCQAVGIVPEIDCWGPLDVDEIQSRGVNPGGHLDESNVQVLCRGHHTWRTENPAEARARGLRLESWETPP